MRVKRKLLLSDLLNLAFDLTLILRRVRKGGEAFWTEITRNRTEPNPIFRNTNLRLRAAAAAGCIWINTKVGRRDPNLRRILMEPQVCLLLLNRDRSLRQKLFPNEIDGAWPGLTSCINMQKHHFLEKTKERSASTNTWERERKGKGSDWLGVRGKRLIRPCQTEDHRYYWFGGKIQIWI